MPLTLKKHGGLWFAKAGRARFSFCMVKPALPEAPRERTEFRSSDYLTREERRAMRTGSAISKPDPEAPRGSAGRTLVTAAMLTLAMVTALDGGKLTRPVAAAASVKPACEIVAIAADGSAWVAGSGSSAAAAYDGLVLPRRAVDVFERGNC